MIANLSVSAVDGIDALVRFSSEIDRFNLAAKRPNPFLSSEFLRCYAEHSEYHVPGAEERLFLIRDGARLIGCAPMRRTTDSFGHLASPLGLRGVRLRFLAPLDTELPGILCAPEDEERVAQALINHLLAREPVWGMLELVGQRPQSGLYRAAHSIADGRFRVRDVAVEPYNEIALVWADVHSYFRSLPRKMRSNVSRLARRLFAAGNAELVLASGTEAASAWFEAYCDLDRRSWKQGTGSSISRSPRRVRFYRELVAGHAGLDPWFVGVVLDGVLVAGLIAGSNTAPAPDRRGAWCLEIAYDQSMASLGPGHLLLLIAVAMAIGRGDPHLNFMQNFAYYKQRWGAEPIEVVNVQVIRRASLHNARALIGELRRWLWPARPASAGHVPQPEAAETGAQADAVGAAASDHDRALQLTQAALAAGGAGMQRLTREQSLALLPFDVP